MNPLQYLQQLLMLLPRGALWRADPGGVLYTLLSAFSQEPARVDLRAQQILDEADPRTTVEMLPDYERVFGLPDPDAPPPLVIADRQAALTSKMTSKGGQSRQFFIDLAAKLGYPITITEFRPSTCETTCETPCYEDDARFLWQVNGPATHFFEATCESTCEDPLEDIGNDLLEAAINRHQPAHMTLIYSFT